MLSPTDEIKNRIDIVDFISNYTSLKRAGSNFKACCPFHNEKTPSFMVSKAKQLWYCFGACNEGGDVFKFLMKIEGIDFPEALKILADKAGIELPRYDKKFESQKNTLLEIMRAATDLYKQELKKSDFAKKYLISRGLSDFIVEVFELGYAPDDWETLVNSLKVKFKVEDIAMAGLAIASSRGKGFFDRFRHRIMFPIKDLHGNPVGFTSRLLDEARKEGKYVNTPETPLYNKGRILYGLDLAKSDIRKHDYAVIVEGNMDAITCHQFKMNNVVASSGTALTIDQVRILKRYTDNLAIAFDSDAAGESAAKRGIDIAVSQGMRVKVIVIPPGGGKDPDECIRKDVKSWEDAIKNAKEIMEFYFEKSQAKFDINTAQGRSGFVNALLFEVSKIPDLIQKDFWFKKISEFAKVDEKTLHDQARRIETRGPAVVGKTPLVPVAVGRLEQLSKRLLALLLNSSDQIGHAIANILPEMLEPESFSSLYNYLTACYTEFNNKRTGLPDANFSQFWRNWAEKQAPNILSTADVLELYGDNEFQSWEDAQRKSELRVLVAEIRRVYSKKQRTVLQQEMKKAEDSGDKERVRSITKEFGTLSNHE